MVRKSVFLFILCACPLFPALSRFYCGLIFTLAFCVSFFALLGARKLISLCSLKKEYALIIEILSLLLCVALFSALVRLALPLAAFSLDFFICAVPFIYLLFEFLSSKYNAGDDSALATVLIAIAFPPAVSLLRELLYFGTISFPAIGEIYSFEVFPSNVTEFTRFFGSLHGFLILIGLVVWLWNKVEEKKSRPQNNHSIKEFP